MPENNKIYKLRYTTDKARVQEQIIASKLYAAMGIRTPEYIPFEKDGKGGYLVEMFEEELTPAPKDSQALYDSFVVDAWLGNRNGLSRNNTMMDKDGNIVKMSVSGSLSYRATGKLKTDKISDYVDELSSMRDPKLNQDAAEALENMNIKHLSIALNNFKDKYSKEKIQEIVQDYAVPDGRKLSNIMKYRTSDIFREAEYSIGDAILEKRGMSDKTIKQLRGRTARSGLLEISDKKWELLKSRGIVTSNTDMVKSGIFLKDYANMSDEVHQKAVERELYGLSYPRDIEAVANLSEEEWQAFKERGYIDEYNKCGNLNQLIQFARVDAEVYNEYRDFFEDHYDRGIGNSTANFIESSQKDKEGYFNPPFKDRIRTILNAAKRYDFNISPSYVIEIASNDNDVWNKMVHLSNNFTNFEKSIYTLEVISKLSDEDFSLLKQRIGDEVYNESRYTLSDIAALTDEQWNNMLKRDIRNLEGYRRDYHYDFIPLAMLSDEEFKKAKDNHFFDSRNLQGYVESIQYLSGEIIAELVSTLSDEELENIKKRELLTNFRCHSQFDKMQPLNDDAIGQVAQLSDEEFETLKQLSDHSRGTRVYVQTLLELVTSLNATELERTFERDLVRRFSDTYEARDNWSMDADVIKMLSELDDEEYKSFLNQKNTSKSVATKTLIVKLDKSGIKDKDAVNELSFRQKKAYLDLLITKADTIFSDDFQANYTGCKILPTSNQEYTNLINELVKSLGINTNPLSEEQKSAFYSALDKLASPNSDFAKTDFEQPGFKLTVKYPRESFIKDIDNLTRNIEKSEKIKIWDYFGFELSKGSDGNTILSGFPTLVNNGEKLQEIENPNTIQLINEIKPYIKNFTKENSVIADGKFITDETAEILNSILDAFPELYSIIGAKQHKTHDYTIDIHTLNVLQKSINNQIFKKLDKEDKRKLMLAILMHDIAKTENSRDKNHAKYSAYSAYYLLEKLDLEEETKLDIYKLIKNHEFLKDATGNVYDKKTDSYIPISEREQNRIIKQYAWELSGGELANMERILTEADLLSVQKDGRFYNKYGKGIDFAFDKLNKQIETIQKNAIVLPKTKIPKASSIMTDNKNVCEVLTKGKDGKEIKNKVIYLSENLDLEQYGFAKGTNTKNLNVLIHGFDTEKQQAVLGALGLVDQNPLLSASHVNYEKGNYHAFRPFGYILDTTDDNIGAAYYRDFGSGCKKTADTLVDSYIDGFCKKYRQYIPSLVKKELNISDEEYIKLYKRIKNKPMSTLEQEEPEVAEAYKKIFNKMEIRKRTFGRDYNEILITRGIPAAAFFEGRGLDGKKYTVEDIPEFLRKYAEENDIPIVYFGE